MRLLTHNLLACLKCGAFPLALSATELRELPSECDVDFTRRMLARINYDYLVKAYTNLVEEQQQQQQKEKEEKKEEEKEDDEKAPVLANHTLPATLDEIDLGDDSAQLREVYYALNVVAVKEGCLRCEECQTTYNVHEYIPNFVLDGH